MICKKLRGIIVALACASIHLHAESILLSEATVHTISGETLSPGQVLMKDGKIAEVGQSIKTKADKVIKLNGLHLYPGMVALTTTLGLTEIGSVRATQDSSEVGEYTPEVQSWVAVNPDSELLPVARANGVGYVLPLPRGGVIAGQTGLVKLDGWTVEEMLVQGPVALHLYWPSMGLNTTPKDTVRDKSKWKSIEEQAKDRRAKLQAIDEFFDDARAYDKGRTAKTIKDLERIPGFETMGAYIRGEKPIIIHADDIREIKTAVNWALTNKLKAIIAGGRDAWKVAPFLASNNIPVIYEHVYAQPQNENDPYDVYYKAPSVLHSAGVKFALSLGPSTSDAALIKNLPYLAAQTVGYGLPQEEAIKAITSWPAEILGLDDRIGSIKQGAEATIVAFDGDPLDFRSNVQKMWIAGKEVSLESRHTRLYEKYKNRPRPQ